MDSRKSSTKENQNTVRKYIFRNLEVPLNNEQTRSKRITINDTECPNRSENKEQQTSRKSLREPTINKLAEWRKVLEEVKQYTIQDSTMEADIGQSAQKLINHAVTLKLNFPTRETVFKNLPKIDEDGVKKTNRVTEKLQKKSDSSENIKDRVQRMLNEMVELEEKNKRKNVSASYTDEWMKVNKFNEPSYKLPNVKTEREIYLEQLRKDVYHYRFSSDGYISTKVTFNPSSKPNNKPKANDCKCMSDFYTRHSMCS